MRYCGDVGKAGRYLKMEIRGVVWSGERYLRETDIKRILKILGMDGKTQERGKSRG